MGAIGGRLYDVWEVYGDPRGPFIEILSGHFECSKVYEFGKCMGTPGGHL